MAYALDVTLREISLAIAKLRETAESRAPLLLPPFSDDRLIVERAIEIISEASRRLPPEWKDARPEVPWRRIADIGNHLRHAYQRVDAEILVAIVETGLDDLERAVDTGLDDAGC